MVVLLLLLLSFGLRLLWKKETKNRVIITYKDKREVHEMKKEPEIITIDQGNGMVNKIYISSEEVYMLESSCNNQLCVQQGKMMPGKIRNRLMGRYIICLPHELTVEMETEEKTDK